MNQNNDFDLTIATTAHNEAGNLPEFFRQCAAAVQALQLNSEMIFIDDGSRDATSEGVVRAQEQYPQLNIRLIRNKRSQGITAAISSVAQLAQSEWVCLLPADLESFPIDDIPALYQAIGDDVDVVAGWRQQRADGKSFSSRIFNRLNARWFGVPLQDANWIKLVRREALEGLPLRKNWHRFLTAFLAKRGCRMIEVPVQWHARSYGHSKFNLTRLPAAALDLITVKAFLDFGHRPVAAYAVLALFNFMLAISSAGMSLIFLDVESGLLGLGLMFSTALILMGISLMGFGLVLDRRYRRKLKLEKQQKSTDSLGAP